MKTGLLSGKAGGSKLTVSGAQKKLIEDGKSKKRGRVEGDGDQEEEEEDSDDDDEAVVEGGEKKKAKIVEDDG